MNDSGLSLREALGLAIRLMRERSGLSQEELANRTGLHRTYVGSVERGERNPGLKNIDVLATALGLSASQLLAEAEKLQGSRGRSSQSR